MSISTVRAHKGMVSLFVINRLQQVKLEQVERRVENKKFSFSFMLGWFWDLLSKLSWKFSDKPPPYESHSKEIDLISQPFIKALHIPYVSPKQGVFTKGKKGGEKTRC